MSIGFYVNQAEVPVEKVYYKDRYGFCLDDQFYELDPMAEKDERGYYFLEQKFISEDFCNANARRILQALGLPDDDCGSVEAHELPALRRRIIRLLNTDDAAGYTRDASVQQEPGGPTMVGFGYSEQDLKDGLTRVLRIITEAQERGTGIYWA